MNETLNNAEGIIEPEKNQYPRTEARVATNINKKEFIKLINGCSTLEEAISLRKKFEDDANPHSVYFDNEETPSSIDIRGKPLSLNIENEDGVLIGNNSEQQFIDKDIITKTFDALEQSFASTDKSDRKENIDHSKIKLNENEVELSDELSRFKSGYSELLASNLDNSTNDTDTSHKKDELIINEIDLDAPETETPPPSLSELPPVSELPENNIRVTPSMEDGTITTSLNTKEAFVSNVDMREVVEAEAKPQTQEISEEKTKNIGSEIESRTESSSELTDQRIGEATSLKDLSLVLINSQGIISQNEGHFSGTDLAFLIQQVGKGDAYIEEITRKFGLREKVYNLLLSEKGFQAKSLQHEEESKLNEMPLPASSENVEVANPTPQVAPEITSTIPIKIPLPIPASKPKIIPLPPQNQKVLETNNSFVGKIKKGFGRLFGF